LAGRLQPSHPAAVSTLVRGTESDAPLRTLLEAVQGEALAERVTGATVLTRLADVVIARVVRAWESRTEEASGWLQSERLSVAEVAERLG